MYDMYAKPLHLYISSAALCYALHQYQNLRYYSVVAGLGLFLVEELNHVAKLKDQMQTFFFF